MKQKHATSPEFGRPAILPAIALTAIFVSIFSGARGDVYITALEKDGNTTLEWSGSLDVSKFRSGGRVGVSVGSVFPKMGVLSGSQNVEVDVYLFESVRMKPFGEGGASLSASGSGDSFLILSTLPDSGIGVCLPSGYTGGKIQGQITFTGASLESLGISKETFAYDLGGQYIVFSPGPYSFSRAVSPRDSSKKTLGEILSGAFPKKKKR